MGGAAYFSCRARTPAETYPLILTQTPFPAKTPGKPETSQCLTGSDGAGVLFREGNSAAPAAFAPINIAARANTIERSTAMPELPSLGPRATFPRVEARRANATA